MIRGSMGPTKTILIGYRIVDTVLFHPISDSVPRKDSPLSGMSLTTDRKITLEIKRKANPEMRKRETNFFLEIFIAFNFSLIIKSTL
ncbi:MAG: hypothetical protein JWP67_2388 [Mucilaginibacter sp.]|nr:hypothetical protein [Mucilaginibacter sp.]